MWQITATADATLCRKRGERLTGQPTAAAVDTACKGEES